MKIAHVSSSGRRSLASIRIVSSSSVRSTTEAASLRAIVVAPRMPRVNMGRIISDELLQNG